MNELKPEDVMRALECCDGTLGGCERCPNYKNRFCCTIKENALALLREKDAEIERLEKHLDYKCVYGYDGEVMEFCVQGPCPHYNMEKQVRAEAITEFAERLKKFYANLKGKTVGGSVEYHIDQIAGEMREKQ